MTAPQPILGALEHELTRELWSGPLGACWLGHITAGHEAGRAVIVHRVPGLGARGRSITEAAREAQRLSHPSFLKVLGGMDLGGEVRIVSEELRAVSLRDLPGRLSGSGAALPPPVAVRIVCDALGAVSALRARLGKKAGERSARALLPDTTLVTDFGETLLTEVVVTGALVAALRPRNEAELFRYLSPEELEPSIKPGEVYESSEVWSAAVILWELLAGRTLQRSRGGQVPPLDRIERLGLPVPSSLARAVERALDPRPERRPATVALFAAELCGLGPRLCASSEVVQQVVEPLLPHRPQRRAQKPWAGPTPWGEPLCAVRETALALASSLEPPSSEPSMLRLRSPAALALRRQRRASWPMVLCVALLAAALLSWLVARGVQKIQYKSSSGITKKSPTTKLTAGTL